MKLPVFTGSVLSGMTPLVLWRSKTDISLCATMVSLIAACDANPWVGTSHHLLGTGSWAQETSL